MIALTHNDHFFDPNCKYNTGERIDVQASIVFYGVTDFTTWYEPYGRFLGLGESYFGVKEPNDELLKIASPVNYSKEAEGPFLIIQGTEDIGVPIEQAQELHNALLDSKKESRILFVEGANHAFDGAIWSDFTRQAELAIDEFLNEYFGR